MGTRIGNGIGAWYIHNGNGTWIGTGTGTIVWLSLISSRSTCVDASLTMGEHSVAFDSQKGLHDIILLRNCFTVLVDCVTFDFNIWFVVVEVVTFVDDKVAAEEDSAANFIPDELVWFEVVPFAICVKTGSFELLFNEVDDIEDPYLTGWLRFGTCWFIKKFWLELDKTVPGAVDLRANCFGPPPPPPPPPLLAICWFSGSLAIASL